MKTSGRCSDRHSAVEPFRDSILDIDRMIGGIGIDRLLVPVSNTYTGDYPEDERPIHRPLQYALIELLDCYRPRDAIRESCQHIEGILKMKFAEVIHNIDFKPLGSIVKDVKSMNLLRGEIIWQIEHIAHILNIAKHEYGLDAVQIPDPLRRIESQVFNIHEAVSMYFICRKLGILLLAESGTPQR